MKKLIIVSLFFLVGCFESYGKVASTAVDQAVVANNTLVSLLEQAQAITKNKRKSLLKQIATSAATQAQGEADMAKVSQKYEPIFNAFKKAEVLQNSLADTLVASQAALKAGKSPNLSSAIELYSKLQQAHASIAKSLAELQ
jgi:hypothetical protein